MSVNTNWGNVTDRNAFGTHEFLDLMEQLGSEAYISVNLGSGTPQEARDWVEYMTSESDSTLANLRRKNGRDKPWKVSFLGIGNEPWGCGGNMRSEYYADEYRRYQGFVHAANWNIARYASGASGDDYQWTEVLMRQAGTLMDGISLHYYTLPSGSWIHKGAATGFDEAAWAITLKRTLRMEELLRMHGAVMDKYDAGKKVALAVDEWGTWYDAEPGTNPGFLMQQNTLRDAMGRLHLSLVNVDPHRSAQLSMHIAGFNASRVSGRVLTARAMDAHNSFDRPDIVKPVQFTGATLEHGDGKLNLPAQSVVALELQ